jgi:hypothetical protein
MLKLPKVDVKYQNATSASSMSGLNSARLVFWRQQAQKLSDEVFPSRFQEAFLLMLRQSGSNHLFASSHFTVCYS